MYNFKKNLYFTEVRLLKNEVALLTKTGNKQIRPARYKECFFAVEEFWTRLKRIVKVYETTTIFRKRR